MTVFRRLGPTVCGALLVASPMLACAQSAPGEDAPTAPTVPPTAQIAANPMPARRAELDSAASHSDFAAIRGILAAPKSGDDVNRNMDWEELQIVEGGSVFYSFRYLDDLWFVGSEFPDPTTAAKIKRFAGVVALYTLQQIEIDGARCVDPSAPGHRIDQLTVGRGPVWKFVLGLPEVTRRDLVVEAMKLEARTAKLRRDDPVLCSGGMQDMTQALRGDATELSAQSGGRRELKVTPHPAYVAPAVSSPKQAQTRANMPMLLARLLKLPEAQPKSDR